MILKIDQKARKPAHIQAKRIIEGHEYQKLEILCLSLKAAYHWVVATSGEPREIALATCIKYSCRPGNSKLFL